jgi:hypothetical protein
MRRIRSVTINGKRWRVIWKPMRSDWGSYDDQINIIEMDTGIKDSITYATILMHEMLHAMLPNVEEKCITQMADDLAVALHRATLIAKDTDET